MQALDSLPVRLDSPYLFAGPRDASLIAAARFEEAEEEPLTLVIPGGVGGQMGFSASIGGNSFDSMEVGFVRLRAALSDLVRNQLFVAEVTAAETRTTRSAGEGGTRPDGVAVPIATAAGRTAGGSSRDFGFRVS